MEKETEIGLAPAGVVDDALKSDSGKELESSSKSSEVPNSKPTEVDYDAKATNKAQFSDYFVLPSFSNTVSVFANHIGLESFRLYYLLRQSCLGICCFRPNWNWRCMESPLYA